MWHNFLQKTLRQTAFIWPLNFLFISLGMGISVGATALIAQYFGAGKYRDAKRYAGNAMVLTYFFGFVLSVLGYFLAPLFVELDGSRGDLPGKIRSLFED